MSQKNKLEYKTYFSERGRTNMVYAIADIHGEYERFKELLDKCHFKSEDTLYILGDAIDRGEASLETLRYIMNQPNMHMIKGNHESILEVVLNSNQDLNKVLEVLKRFKEAGDRNFQDIEDDEIDVSVMPWSGLKRWYLNGGEVTVKQLLELDIERIEEIRDYILGLPLYQTYESKEGKQYLLVHAGVNVMPTDYEGEASWDKLKAYQGEKDLIWIREAFYLNEGLKDKIVVFGHTPTYEIHQSNKIWMDTTYHDKIGIDCGASYKEFDGKLACINLDTLEVYYA